MRMNIIVVTFDTQTPTLYWTVHDAYFHIVAQIIIMFLKAIGSMGGG